MSCILTAASLSRRIVPHALRVVSCQPLFTGCPKCGTSHSFHTSTSLQEKPMSQREKQMINFGREAKEALTRRTVGLDDTSQWSDEEDTKTSQEEGMSSSGTLAGYEEYGYMIPTLATHDSVIDGMLYTDVPIVHISARINNTHVILVNGDETEVLYKTSCGVEGFRNIKKTSSVAAQATGYSMGIRAKKRGIQTVRVVLQGIGSGRAPCLKGLENSGLKIISLTDRTPIPYNGLRPRKVRRM